MSDPQQSLTSLIEKLGAAERPSRELDALVHTAVTGRDVIYDGGERPHSAVIVGTQTWTARDGSEQSTVEGYAPNYTSSLDDASTAVPAMMFWSVGTWSGNFATCGNRDWGIDINAEGHANTAICLCIASLKARAKLTETSHG